MNQKDVMNFWIKYMNGQVEKAWNYYIEELEMVCSVKYFTFDAIIKDPLFAYSKMKMDIFLEDMQLLIGIMMKEFIFIS